MPIKWTARGKRIVKGAAIGVAGFVGGHGVAKRRAKRSEHLAYLSGAAGYDEMGRWRKARMRNPKTGKVTARQAQRARGQKKKTKR